MNCCDNARAIQFMADAHLGRLAKYLRMLGFDTAYCPHLTDKQLIQLAQEQQRMILTKDRGIIEQNALANVYGVKAVASRAQLQEVMRHFQLASCCRLFTRCLRCNGVLVPVAKQTIIEQLPPNTRQYYHDFLQCQQCAKIYWQGSHYQRMQQFCHTVLNTLNQEVTHHDNSTYGNHH